MDIKKGTIVTVIEERYIDFEGGKWANHFVPMKKHYIAKEEPRNNGTFKARDLKTSVTWLNVADLI